MNAAITLDGVGHRFQDGPWLLRELALRLVADGSSTAIVAPSGSGKTTLLSIVGGLLKPALGRRIVEATEPEHCCAWVFQTTNVLGARSCLDNAAMTAKARGLAGTEARQAALAVLDRVGIAHLADAPARQLSGGERQRLAIARALLARRPFLLADEPTGQLDTATSAAVSDVLFLECLGSDRHLVVVTHDESIANRCDRVLGLVSGRLALA